MAAGYRNVIEEDVRLGMAASGGSRLVQQEAGTRIRAALDHQECLALCQVIGTGNGSLVAIRAVFHLLEQVCAEYRCGLYLWFRGSGVLAHCYLRGLVTSYL